MENDQYDIIFKGGVLDGHASTLVKQRLSRLFKITPEQIEKKLFTGTSVTLKRNMDAAAAEKYQAALTRAGACVSLVKSVKEETAVKADATAVETAVKAAVKSTVKRVPSPVTVDTSVFTLAPLGADLIEQKEQKVVDVDVSGLSVRPLGAELLDKNERAADIQMDIDFPDFEVAEVGADLLKEDEKLAVPQVSIDGIDFEIAPLDHALGG